MALRRKLTSPSNRPDIVITMGDPSGVGAEVTVKALASSKVRGLANFFVVGDGAILEKAARRSGVKAGFNLVDMGNVRAKTFSYGRAQPEFGKAAIEYIDEALRMIRMGAAGALVTAPINKSAVQMAGFSGFEGHTEYLAAKTGTKDFAMMFVGERLKITLVTRHIALKDIQFRLTAGRILKAITLTDKSLRNMFGIKNPKIGVAGLNPHAGESGMFGDEEARIIVPAIKKSAVSAKGVSGPYPPDVIFGDALNGKFDAVIAMYHDQGLIPFKLLYFKDGVNMTIGLPFVRTSPDHGTAFDIAGKGIADPSSMIEAIRLACRLKRCSPKQN